jgi:hypothetical protein
MTGLSRADRARVGLVRIRQEAQRERMDKYTALRDAGALPADAAREVGLSSSTLYERSYRELRGLPRAAGRFWDETGTDSSWTDSPA